jgi:uncharacterized protein YjbJ (UPF0337 family)
MTDQEAHPPESRVKEAVGSVTDDQEPNNEGRADQPASSIKEKVEHAMAAVRERFTGDDKK